MSTNNIRYAISLALTLYDVDIDTDDAIEIALIAYNFIGNKRTRLKRAISLIECDTQRVKLPCNCDLIEAVTYISHEDWQYSSNIHEFGDINTSYIEDYIEGNKSYLDPLYQRGKFVKYRREGDYIYVNQGFGYVVILYHELITDEENLPEINDKEAIAIAEYIAYTSKYKEAIKTNNRTLFEMARELKLQWLFHCDAARVPEYISQNEADMILDSVSSYNRKKYGYSYKPTL